MQEIVRDILIAVTACLTSGTLASDAITISQSDVDLIVDSLWDYFAIVGIGMTIIYFLLEINQKLAFERSDFSMHSFGAPFIKLMVAIAIMANGGTIIGACVALGNAFAEWADTTYEPAAGVIADLNETIEELTDGMGFFVAIAMLLPAFLMFVISSVCTLVWKWKGLSYKLEVFFRLGISPIALADVYSGQNAQAIRWIKSMLGLGIYGASFIIIAKMGNALATSDWLNELTELLEGTTGVWDMLTAFATVLLIPIAELSVISAVRSAIKEALA